MANNKRRSNKHRENAAVIRFKEMLDIIPSPTESIIIKHLRSHNIIYAREVVFDGCINPSTGQPLRYDFYLPEYNLIVEYDGIGYHDNNGVRKRDAIKDRFAKNNCIRLIRIVGIKNITIAINRVIQKYNRKSYKYHKTDLKNESNKKEKKTQEEIRKAISKHSEYIKKHGNYRLFGIDFYINMAIALKCAFIRLTYAVLYRSFS